MTKNVAPAALELLKAQLTGADLRRVLAEKGISKYRLSKSTGISYQTLCTWQRAAGRPSNRSALIVGVYLGLIKPTEADLLELRQQIAELQQQLDRISAAAA
jgi:lambda repressor-like predicted transcriptional regulator